jgi:hypothetical protein
MTSSFDGVSDEAFEALARFAEWTNKSPTSLPNSPEVISSKEVGRNPRSQTKYPWDLWMNGKVHVAMTGIDYKVSKPVFQTMLHNFARRNEIFVATMDLGPDGMRFQYVASQKVAQLTKMEWRNAWEEEFDDGYGDVGPEDD